MGRMRGVGSLATRARGTGATPAARRRSSGAAAEGPVSSFRRAGVGARARAFVFVRGPRAYAFASLASPRIATLVYPRGVGACLGRPGARRERAAAAAALQAKLE